MIAANKSPTLSRFKWNENKHYAVIRTMEFIAQVFLAKECTV